MIITISGTAGSGKSTVGKLLAKRLGYKHYSSGDFMREMADERKISLLELNKAAEKDQGIDEEIDTRQIDLGRNEDNFVLDARLAFHFIPNSLKVFLDADFEERAKRILADTIRREHNVNIVTTRDAIKKREESEKKRYSRYYNISPYEKKHYDLVIDTTKKSPEEAVKEILHFIKDKSSKKKK